MSNAVLASNLVSLEDYRRAREKKPTHRYAPVAPYAAAVWVYWVPVWIW